MVPRRDLRPHPRRRRRQRNEKGRGALRKCGVTPCPSVQKALRRGSMRKKKTAHPTGVGEESDENRQVGDELLWPWGSAGRLSDRSDSPGILSQRPNEPEGDPPSRDTVSSERTEGGTISLTPSRMWLDVQQVQEHMARARREQARR